MSRASGGSDTPQRNMEWRFDGDKYKIRPRATGLRARTLNGTIVT